MAKHKSRYGRTTLSDVKKNLKGDESPEQLREEFPSPLVVAYVKLVNSEFSDCMYGKYIKVAAEFLGEKFKDPIEQGKLTVRLTKATFDLVDKYNEKKKKKKVRKNKEDEGLARSQCALPQVGSNEGQEQEEGKEQTDLPQGN